MNIIIYNVFSKSITFFLFIIFCFALSLPSNVHGSEYEALILDSSIKNISIYPTLYMLGDNEKKLTIDDVTSQKFSREFIHADDVKQASGFFERATWLRLDVINESKQKEWLLEFAFPLIYYINIYVEDESGIRELEETGAEYPFNQREINHRNFLFNIEIEPTKLATYYVLVHGGGDLQPPINIWEADSFIEKTQVEFVLLGLFYGMILVMILYNLFLYFSLRLKSYLFYVLAITAIMMGQLSINGLGFQFIWSNYPAWNLISTPFWVSVACILILIFTRHFLDAERYIPTFKPLSHTLMGLNLLVIIFLFISHYVALNLMIFSAISTFIFVLTAAFVSLKRGARQARFFILGWVILLVGVTITILERAALLPFSIFTEYAGQLTLTIEVLLLSLALADKINIMRAEKSQLEIEAKESQLLTVESLKQADELKDEFLAITSHEIRTPLYGIIGIAESLRDGAMGDVPTKVSNQLSMIISSGNRLTLLVNDILDFSKLKHNSVNIHLKPVNLSDMINVIFTICQPLIKNKSIKLVNNIKGSTPSVIADPNRLQQVLYNLIGNAIKFTNEGKVSVSTQYKDGLIKINVSDTGKGISEEQQKTIFDPFTQGDISISRDVGGTGIGLSITKQLIELQNGTLEVESVLGKGSTFSFLLPASPHSTMGEATTTLESTPKEISELLIPDFQTTKERPKILVADDELVNLQVLTNHLTLEGYDVVTASDGEAVLRIVKEQPIELLILDVMMPKMSGYEVCQQLREEYTLIDLPILMLTAKSQMNDKITSFEVGANDYLAKPCDKQELLSRVRTLVRLRSLNKELITVNLQLEDKVEERTKALKVANVDLTNVNDQLVNMAKSRQSMLANIAHELGTPVTLIHSYVQALQQGLVEADDAYFSNLVDAKIMVLSRLISDLSDLSTLEAGQTNLQFEQVELGGWLEQIHNNFKQDIQRYDRSFIGLVMNNEFKGIECSIDMDRMDQVFTNLISNAVKNTPEKDGEISIEAELDKTNKKIIIQVKDNGYGLSEENSKLIFERFYKAPQPDDEKNDSSTGLGLAIVKEIVQAHKGEIWVKSKLNEGTTFYISLPISTS